jgi:hypothetical protein
MGEMIGVSCAGCGFLREDTVGVGFAGVGQELCICSRCHHLVLVDVACGRGGQPVRRAQCPGCQRFLRRVASGDPCPVCDGQVVVEVRGMWD